MSDWIDDEKRRQREWKEEQRLRQQAEAEDRRHEERMSLERERDRIASMRARGMTEDEIDSVKRKEGCLAFVALLVLGAVVLVLSNLGSHGADNRQQGETIEEAQAGEPPAEDYLEDAEPSDLPQAIDSVTTGPAEQPEEPTPATEPTEQVQFISEPVVQALPDAPQTATSEPPRPAE
ncbi:hypothetical protein [Tsuneonella troitsensis]|uniref:hypothetical protein n=2 Tax=Tsuneonella troitsensis TaxID=292222 RepID=UPI000AF3DEAE|nr:hypothetical protein [Tsuneonella troitsensis]